MQKKNKNPYSLVNALKSPTLESRLVWDCFNVINDMARVNNLTKMGAWSDKMK